jgi:hypothetical protein
MTKCINATFAAILSLIGATACTPNQGIIWTNHRDFAVNRVELQGLQTSISSGGDTIIQQRTDIAVEPRPVFFSAVVPSPPPGFHLTGVRVCVGVEGDSPDTGIKGLRLVQFDETSRPGSWPGFPIKLEDTTVTSPPAGAFEDPASFACIDSERTACVDTTRGTAEAAVRVFVGDGDDRIWVRALGTHYDRTCDPF